MCGSTGKQVKSTTVEHVAKFKVDSLKKEIMNACLDPECEIVYFSSAYYPLVFGREIDTDVGYKTFSNYNYVCYCHKIESEDIVKSVIVHGARAVKDIISQSGDVKLNICEKTHPLGCDCTKDIRKIIDDTLRENKIL